jgi:hypothetical protein
MGMLERPHSIFDFISKRVMTLLLVVALTPLGVRAQTIGPGPVAGPRNVPAGTTTVVGSTTITSTGTNAGVNVTNTGTLIFDSTAGPSPGAISVQTVNGNALQAASGGTILIPFPGLTVQSSGGHAAFANGSGSSITFSNGANLGTTGLGSGFVAIGGVINATGVTVNNTGLGSGGNGAIAQGARRRCRCWRRRRPCH